MTKWTLSIAVDLCRQIEALAQPTPTFHVALTGGCLYKDGERKDCDIIVYPHNGTEGEALIDTDAFMSLVAQLDIRTVRDAGRVIKAQGLYGPIDFIFPGRGKEYDAETQIGGLF